MVKKLTMERAKARTIFQEVWLRTFFFKYIRQFFMVGDPLLFYLGIAQIKAGLNLAITGNLQEIKT